MTQVHGNQANWAQRRDEWIGRVADLITQVDEWSQAEGWNVERQRKIVQEKLLGAYEVDALVIRLQGGEIHVKPIALHVVGADGRVDIEAFPTLSRIKLVGVAGGWQIMTDSNVPLREPWNRETFVQLVHDLLS